MLEESLAERAYDFEVAKGRQDYFVLSENPNTYALECSGELPRIEDLIQHFGRNAASDLVIADATMTWTFVLFRESGGSSFGRVRPVEEGS